MYGCITNKSIREAYNCIYTILPQFVFVLVNSQFPIWYYPRGRTVHVVVSCNTMCRVILHLGTYIWKQNQQNEQMNNSAGNYMNALLILGKVLKYS